MKPPPRVSVVIPVRDRAGLVARAIESALAQVGSRFELIVVDDGSCDATPAVLAGYGDRLVAVRQERRGRSSARNAGIARARGEWLAFLDSDDAWLPGKLAAQLAYHGSHPDVAMSAHGLERVHPDGRVERAAPRDPGPASAESFLAIADHFAFVPSAVMVRAEVARAVGGFDATFDGTEDLEFALRVARCHRVGVFPACLTRYFLHEGQTSRRRLASGNARVLEHYLALEMDEATRARMRRRLARHLVSAAKRAESRAERRALLAQAARLDPAVRLRAAWLRQRLPFAGAAPIALSRQS